MNKIKFKLSDTDMFSRIHSHVLGWKFNNTPYIDNLILNTYTIPDILTATHKSKPTRNSNLTIKSASKNVGSPCCKAIYLRIPFVSQIFSSHPLLGKLK